MTNYNCFIRTELSFGCYVQTRLHLNNLNTNVQDTEMLTFKMTHWHTIWTTSHGQLEASLCSSFFLGRKLLLFSCVLQTTLFFFILKLWPSHFPAHSADHNHSFLLCPSGQWVLTCTSPQHCSSSRRLAHAISVRLQTYNTALVVNMPNILASCLKIYKRRITNSTERDIVLPSAFLVWLLVKLFSRKLLQACLKLRRIACQTYT